MASSAPATPTRTASRFELAYHTIRQRIADGRYGPGYRLVLDELAREMGISPVPVREALRRLEAEGYIEFHRNVGARVATFDQAEVDQTLHVVALLEGYATALATPHMRPADLAQARKINERMASAMADFDPVHFSALNREFHFTIYERCPNSNVRALLETQWARLDTIRRSVFPFVPGRARTSVAEHTKILDLIAAGAPSDRIERMARAHKHNTMQAVNRATAR
jgi:DNA-binding GntR family transcriptional regulator